MGVTSERIHKISYWAMLRTIPEDYLNKVMKASLELKGTIEKAGKGSGVLNRHFEDISV